MKSPIFRLFWTLFGQLLGTFHKRLVSMIPWLLNWLIFWIESADFFMNWIIFWIESWVKQYWIEYWINHFLAKFKQWIESDCVSPNPIMSSFVFSSPPKSEVKTSLSSSEQPLNNKDLPISKTKSLLRHWCESLRLPLCALCQEKEGCALSGQKWSYDKN